MDITLGVGVHTRPYTQGSTGGEMFAKIDAFSWFCKAVSVSPAWKRDGVLSAGLIVWRQMGCWPLGWCAILKSPGVSVPSNRAKPGAQLLPRADLPVLVFKNGSRCHGPLEFKLLCLCFLKNLIIICVYGMCVCVHAHMHTRAHH